MQKWRGFKVSDQVYDRLTNRNITKDNSSLKAAIIGWIPSIVLIGVIVLEAPDLAITIVASIYAAFMLLVIAGAGFQSWLTAMAAPKKVEQLLIQGEAGRRRMPVVLGFRAIDYVQWIGTLYVLYLYEYDWVFWPTLVALLMTRLCRFVRWNVVREGIQRMEEIESVRREPVT